LQYSSALDIQHSDYVAGQQHLLITHSTYTIVLCSCKPMLCAEHPFCIVLAPAVASPCAGCISMGGAINTTGNSSDSQPHPQHRNASLPPAISIPRSDGTQLLADLQSGTKLTIQWELMDVPPLDASAVLLWLMAVATVVAGSLWCGSDYALELKGSGFSTNPEDGRHSSIGGASSGGGGGLEILEITMKGAVGFVCVASAMLLLLFFFLNKVFFYIILVGFAAAGAQALGVMLLPLVCKALPRLAANSISLPWGWGDIGVVELMLTPVVLAAAVVWALFRNAAWSWVLQDILGVAIMLLVLRTLRLPNLRVACVLLPLCFAYDVFWVFLQPMLTGSGTSVMVEVAGGGDSHEFLPMLLRVPRLSGPPIIRGSYSLLGFGDVILPGLLVALMRRIDIKMSSSAAGVQSSSKKGGCCVQGGYFVPTVFGYGGGLLLTYVALMFSWFGDQGQPVSLVTGSGGGECTVGSHGRWAG
jgi:signal peptide peptidase-like protein 2B